MCPCRVEHALEVLEYNASDARGQKIIQDMQRLSRVIAASVSASLNIAWYAAMAVCRLHFCST